MEKTNPANRLDILLNALRHKIEEATRLGKVVNWEKYAVFHTSAARLLEEIEGGESREVIAFRRLDGKNQDNEQYYHDLREAKAILKAVKQSFEWHTVVTSGQTGTSWIDNDVVKQAVLDLLYTEQRNHPNRSTGFTAKYLMSRLGQFSRADVMLAIEFLHGEAWLTKEIDKANERYRLSSTAINQYHPSTFKSRPYSTLEIAGSNNVIVLGDNMGSINQDYKNGIHDIDCLVQAIKGTEELSIDQKVIVAADLETIKAQLLKKKPDGGIISLAWTSIKTTLGVAATLAGVADFVAKVGQFIAQFI